MWWETSSSSFANGNIHAVSITKFTSKGKSMRLEFKRNHFTALCLPAPIKNILCLPPSVYLSVKQILVAISQDLKQKTSDPQWILNSYHWTWQRHKSLKQKSFLHIYSQVSIMLRKKKLTERLGRWKCKHNVQWKLHKCYLF